MVVSRKTNRRKTFLDELYLISRAPGKYFVRETISAIVTPRSFFLRKIYALKCKALRYSVFGIPPLTVRGAECMGGASIRARVVQKAWRSCLGPHVLGTDTRNGLVLFRNLANYIQC